MIIAVPVTPSGDVDRRFGKADQVAVAEVIDGKITSWVIHDTDWQRHHAQSPHGTHHGRIVRFLIDNSVEAVVIDHAGVPMINTMQKMGLTVVLDAVGPAKEAVVLASKW